jgi:transcriptional regulator with XRE-family HTH domain
MPRSPNDRRARLDWSRVASNELAKRLADLADESSFRQLEAKSGVSRKSIENIVYGTIIGHPELTTLSKFAELLEVPVWRVQEMIGMDVELPSRDDAVKQLSQMVTNRPELAPILPYLAELTPDEIRAARAFLESLRAMRPKTRGESSPEGEA